MSARYADDNITLGSEWDQCLFRQRQVRLGTDGRVVSLSSGTADAPRILIMAAMGRDTMLFDVEEIRLAAGMLQIALGVREMTTETLTPLCGSREDLRNCHALCFGQIRATCKFRT